ncbi:MAG: UDP-N-acetylglucosamine 2-epimerase (non-hydrolyzing) [Sulfuritalea sp.]|nr:UDP-N-acetylglucosamine 2-epimerase (non-hydrolyzing) [Sulfuritalea sp.]
MMDIMHIVGARPNFMKIAPVIKEMSCRSDIFNQCLVHTGQHYDAGMSDVFFEDLGIPKPDFSLEVGSGSHAWQVAQVMQRFEPVVLKWRPDWVIVVGDVNSTLACALVAAKLGIKVAHIEAGLRSFDRSMPEEINRILTDQLSSLLLTPSRDADDNLAGEGIDSRRVVMVGNVMIDSLITSLPAARARIEEVRAKIGLGCDYALATLHRPSNVDDPVRLGEIVTALDRLSEKMEVVFPVHPRTRQRLLDGKISVAPGVKLIAPHSYIDFLALQAGAKLVLTDSGGIQEETTYLGIPCLTLRPNTERPVTIRHGTNRLVVPGEDIAVCALDALASHDELTAGPPEMWDGQTSRRIADAIITATLQDDM